MSGAVMANGDYGASELVILGLVAWFALMLVLLEVSRSLATTLKGKPANSFEPSGEDMSPTVQRLTRVHANAYEFLPFPLAILLFAVATDATAVTDGLAPWLLAARVGQSVTHLASTSVPAVLVRFIAFFIPQQAILVVWMVSLLRVTG